MNGSAVSVRGLSKSFGRVKALDEACFTVPLGSMAALVGPDGAGKTTILKTLAGILEPASGEIEILEKHWKQDRQELKESLGYLSQRFSLYGELSIDENIEFFAGLHGVKDFSRRRDEILDFTRLTRFRTRQADRLSGGMKQKLALACNLIHRPKLLLLDEPTTGVDPVSRRDFRTLLSLLLRDGVTVFMATPYMDEAERCDPVILLDKGRVLVQGRPAELAERVRGTLLEVACEDSRGAASVLRADPRIEEVQLFGDRLHVLGAEDGIEAAVRESLAGRGFSISGIRRIRPGIEDVFISLVKGEERRPA